MKGKTLKIAKQTKEEGEYNGSLKELNRKQGVGRR